MKHTVKEKVSIVNIEEVVEDILVYNFSVEDNESYVLNGIVSHNCRCSIEPVTEVPDAPASNAKEFDEWLNS